MQWRQAGSRRAICSSGSSGSSPHEPGAEPFRIGFGDRHREDSYRRGPLGCRHSSAEAGSSLEAFAVSTGIVALSEIGDKTQIATVMLAAKYAMLFTVTAGTTLGMMLANVPAVLIGKTAMKILPLAWVRRGMAAVFALLGVLVLAGVGG